MKYNEPRIEIIWFEAMDVITVSEGGTESDIDTPQCSW